MVSPDINFVVSSGTSSRVKKWMSHHAHPSTIPTVQRISIVFSIQPCTGLANLFHMKFRFEHGGDIPSPNQTVLSVVTL